VRGTTGWGSGGGGAALASFLTALGGSMTAFAATTTVPEFDPNAAVTLDMEGAVSGRTNIWSCKRSNSSSARSGERARALYRRCGGIGDDALDHVPMRLLSSEEALGEAESLAEREEALASTPVNGAEKFLCFRPWRTPTRRRARVFSPLRTHPTPRAMV